MFDNPIRPQLTYHYLFFSHSRSLRFSELFQPIVGRPMTRTIGISLYFFLRKRPGVEQSHYVIKATGRGEREAGEGGDMNQPLGTPF